MQKARKLTPKDLRKQWSNLAVKERYDQDNIFFEADVRTYVDRRLVVCGEVAAIVSSI